MQTVPTVDRATRGEPRPGWTVDAVAALLALPIN
jgi:hypothetical protein